MIIAVRRHSRSG